MNRQKEYLEQLSKRCYPEANIAVDRYNKETDKYEPGFRKPADFYENYDERTVFMNEIVFDLDFPVYTKNYNVAQALIEVFNQRRIKPIICETGGKGIHIHIFFDKIEFTSEKNKEIFKKAFQNRLSWKNIRMWIFNTIINDAGIDDKEVGAGKHIDTLPLSFDNFQGTTRLIRDIGGRKFVKENDEYVKYFKTYIPLDEFKNKKLKVQKEDDVRYPDNIELFKINENELLSFLCDYIEETKTNFDNLLNINIDVKYTQLNGVKKLIQGLQTGQRNFGALVLAVACKMDNMLKEDAMILFEEYVKNCSQKDHVFSLNEAKQWLDYIYFQDNIFWNCSQLDELGLHNAYECEYCNKKNKDGMEFLKKPLIIDEIKEILDEEIVGEDATKVLIFLLLLSKDFPSETGKAGWNIPGDPQSQNIILAGESSLGKSYTIKKILKLFGEEEKDYFIISRMTKNAINYYTEENMDGKIIFIEELQGLDENTSQLRVWMSEGKLALKTVEKVKDADGVERNALVKQITKGQPCFVSCQAEGKVEEQLNNRSWILTLDASETQTEGILKFQNDINQGLLKFNKEKSIQIAQALKLLKPYHFKIPFADYKLMKIPTKDIRARRDYQKFLTLIKCSAYLHQQQREIIKEGDNEFIICDIKDYEIARRYSENILGATFSGLTTNQINFINFIKRSSWRDEFTISDIMRNLGKSQSFWFNQLKHLEDLGFVISDKSTNHMNIYRIVEEKAMNIINLPSGDDIKNGCSGTIK